MVCGPCNPKYVTACGAPASLCPWLISLLYNPAAAAATCCLSAAPPPPPQGTTSNGSCLLPFKTGAFLAGLPVLPVVLK